MCGIVGYIGKKEAAPILLDSLQILEYRGYDSAGIAVLCNGKIVTIKAKGKVSVLRSRVESKGRETGISAGTCGIGHTRWATHGKPDDINSHPHMSMSGKVAVVHNGIIENHAQLRAMLESHGYKFVSETDTEVAAHLIEYLYKGDPVAAVREAANMLDGAYALGVIFSEHPDEIIAVKKDSPLIVGMCEGENMIASDIPAVLSHTRDIYRLGEEEMAVVRRDGVDIYNRYGMKIEPKMLHVDWDVTAAAKEGYEHFMLKEIFEQPKTAQKTISAYIRDGHIHFDLKSLDDEYFRTIKSVYVIACGSAYHVGVVGTLFMEKYLRIPARAVLASEFTYMNPLIDEHTLVIAVSQSGETSDTLNAMRYAKERGAKTLSVVNILGSTISAESDDCIYTHAGPEIAVATTKAYSAQLIVMYMLIEYMSIKRGKPFMDEAEFISVLNTLPGLTEKLLKNCDELKNLAELYQTRKDIFFIGKNYDYALSLEASLKLKEISYIHSEAYAAGELKHGTLSLVQNDTLVIAVCTIPELSHLVISNIKEVTARGANVITVATEGTEGVKECSDHVLWLPECADFLQPSLAIVPLQIFAYYVALLRGCSIDQPRNLAKSVTVK